MSNFNTVSEWVDTNVKSITTASDITRELLLDLQAMADAENENLSGRAFNTLRNYQRQDGMRALSAIQLNTHDGRTDDYMKNAFGIVLLKSDPHGTDGIFVIIQVVPDRYVLKTIIRADVNYVASAVTHTYLSLFESSLSKPFMITGTHNGDGQTKIFENKYKHDNKQLIDPVQEAGNNDPFKLTLPNGTVVIP